MASAPASCPSPSPSSPSPPVNPAPWQLRAISAVLPLCLTLLVADGSLLTAHVLCNSISYLTLFPEGILVATKNTWLRRPTRSYSAHVALQMTALMLALLGAAAMLLHQHAKRAPHFTSVHSWLGVSSVLCVEFGGLFGALAFSGLLHLHPEHLAAMKLLHRLLGRIALLLSCAAMLFGLHLFDEQHPRHQGWKSYAVAVGIAVHAVGMQSVLWQTLPLTSLFSSGSTKQHSGDGSSRGTSALPSRVFPARTLKVPY